MRTLNDAFEIGGMRHRRLPARPDGALVGMRQFAFDGIAFDLFAARGGGVYARAYLSESGEVGWYAVERIEGGADA